MYPLFFVRMLGKLLEFTGIEYAIQDGGLPFKLAEHAQLIFFARPREKKWVHENVTFQCSVTPLYDLSSVSEGSKSSTHYLSDKNRFDVSSKGPSSGISVGRRAFARNVESVVLSLR